MEQEEIKNSIMERFNNLQPEIQEAIMNTNYENILVEIGNKYNLTKEQMGELEFNTTLVMLGQTHPDNYEEELMKDLKIPEISTKGVAAEVNEKILKNIIKLLKNNFDEEKEQIGFDQTFSGFPEKVQEAIANSGWKEKLYGIANKYKLTVSQMGILEEVTIQVMRNEIHPNEYEGELSSRITIPKEDISNLVKDVNTYILMSIRELLKGNISENKQTKNLSAQTEEVPLPPYTKLIKNEELGISNEKKVSESYKPTEIPIENINTPINIPKNIVEEKLKGATISNHSTSDYSTPKISTPETEGKPKAFDPYREQF